MTSLNRWAIITFEVAAMNQLLELKRESIEELCRRYQVRRLEVFGSAAEEGERAAAARDVDFLVEFHPRPPGQRADQYFGLLQDLEEMLGRPVDLVMTSAIRNPYFLRRIEPQRRLLYAA
jgi:hypothetical protein